MAEPLKRIIAKRYSGRGLPVTLVMPDGSRLPLSPHAEIDVVARTWRGLKALATPALAVAATYAIGMVFIQHFTSGGTLLDFEPPNYREFISREMQSHLGRSSKTTSARSEPT